MRGKGDDEVFRELVVTRADGAEVFEFVEETLGDVPLAAEREIDGAP